MENKNLSSMALLEIEKLKDQLRKKVSQYGEFKFEDDKWYCSYKHKDIREKHNYTLFFHKLNIQYKDLLKYFALQKQNKILSIQSKIDGIGYFFEYLATYQPIVLQDVKTVIFNN